LTCKPPSNKVNYTLSTRSKQVSHKTAKPGSAENTNRASHHHRYQN
jgi:hypothetical protein